MPIFNRRSFNLNPHAETQNYEVLIHISMGYPSVKGRLHTRYSPVRHSHPDCSGIPFDLHVLGLPLAFILSQDQTLRCNIKVKYFPRSDVTQFFTCVSSLFYLFPIFSMNLFCLTAIVSPLLLLPLAKRFPIG